MPMENKAWVEAQLRELDMVNWDRYYSFGHGISVFGWITREDDDYKDFVVLELDPAKKRVEGYHTSSAEYSEDIGDILGVGHSECQRVEDTLAIANMIRTDSGGDNAE